MGFKEFFCPEGIAVFGSVSPGKLGGTFIEQLLINGYKNIYAINPKGASYKDVPGFVNLADVPAKVDLALIVSPASTVPSVLEQCGQSGITSAIIISSGFSEAGNAEGEKELQRIAKQYNMHFIGPNCAGMINTHWNCAPTFQAYPPQGSTAIISQSGAVGGAIMEWAQSQNLGISKFVSYGNGADWNQIDFLHYIKEDEETKVVGLYIENINNGREFMAALKELSAVKPVVVIKSGRTSSGQRAALSHTGSLAGADAVYDTAFKECGVIRVDSLDEMIDLCKAFAHLPEVKGRNIGIVTNSGGPGVMTTDLAENLGMNISEPGETLKEEMRAFLPSFASVRNPVDLTVQGTDENYQKAIEIMLKEYDAVIPIFFGPPHIDTLPIAEGFARAFKNTGKPVACAMETGLNAAKSVQLLADNNLPNFSSTERAIKTLSYMAQYHEFKSKLQSGSDKVTIPQASTEVISSPLLEPQAVEILAKNGIAVPKHCFAETPEQAVKACDTIGFPLVMKVVSPKIIHKSDFGGVKVNLKSEEEVLSAFESIKTAAEGYDFKGVMLYSMVSGNHEVILGLTRDAQFGPVVAFGMGGIFTEVLKDVTLRTAPVSVETAHEMIKEIKGFRILNGLRGQAAINMDALAEMISSFSMLPYIYPTLQEADLNPVFVNSEGATAGDVRLIFK